MPSGHFIKCTRVPTAFSIAGDRTFASIFLFILCACRTGLVSCRKYLCDIYLRIREEIYDLGVDVAAVALAAAPALAPASAR